MTHPAPIIAVVHVGQALETARQPLTDSRFTDKALSPGLEVRGVSYEHSENPMMASQVMGVECLGDCLQRFDGHRRLLGHRLPSFPPPREMI